MALAPISAAASPYAAPPVDPAQTRPQTERPRAEAPRPPAEEPTPEPRALRASPNQDLAPQAAAAQVAYQFQTLQNPATRLAERQNAQVQQARVNMVI